MSDPRAPEVRGALGRPGGDPVRSDTGAVVAPGPGRQNYNVTLATLVFAGIAFALQQTMVVPALPVLQREFDTSAAWAAWLLTGFLLSASVSTPLLGKLGDQYGKERMLVISLSIFLAGSIGAIFAWHIGVLIAFRIVQGCGAAVFPLAFAIIKDEFPPEKVGTAIGTVSAVFGIGGGLGLALSGVLIDHLGWRWLFIVGAAGVAAAVVLVVLFVPESPIKTPSRLDVAGRAPALGRPARAPRGAHGGRELGLDLRPDARAPRRRGGRPHRLGRRRAPGAGASGRHAHDDPPPRSCSRT